MRDFSRRGETTEGVALGSLQMFYGFFDYINKLEEDLGIFGIEQ